MRPQSQGDSSAGNNSKNVEHETCNMFDISDDDEEYEGRDSLYSVMESERLWNYQDKLRIRGWSVRVSVVMACPFLALVLYFWT
ncbi:hypothetical protein F2Q69_00012035 [Brassica cretica]|uniref:Uncharacterized protein n=1 Tax=Brassica cretica TaxID=69181 RepID=A0A8S9QVY6_BRACR|nr:hypothetical protein F2Q69_00012035 [Brassica cretica]